MPAKPPPAGVRLTVTDDTDNLVSGFTVRLEQRLSDGDWFTLRLERWDGLMVDLLTTLAEDAVGAYLYGNSALSIVESYDGVRRVARAHQVRHRYD